MCGLAGVVSWSPSNDATDLRPLIPYLRRRGPDDFGQHSMGACTFLHARLAINDLSSNARQPFLNEDQTVMAICNGEIYNHAELRTRVLARGHHLRSYSDNEILVHLYEDYGEGFISMIEGEFAFAIWDIRRETLLLSRDPFGVKPLYYLQKTATFYFSSDFSSLAREVLSDKTLSRDALNLYVVFRYVPAPLTLFDGIRKLPPGHYLRVRRNSCDVCRYWEYRPAPHAALGIEEATRNIRDNVLEAVESRLMSDVPFGVFLSGGLDSAILVAALRMLGRSHIKTYSIGFLDEGNDTGNEFSYSDAVALAFESDHTKIVGTEATFYDDFQIWIEAMGEPVAAPAAIPLLHLSRRVAQDVKVVLNGQGADEMFGGYLWYQSMCRQYGQQAPHELYLDCYAGIQERQKNRLLTDSWREPEIAATTVNDVLGRLERSIVQTEPLCTAAFLDAHFGLPEVGLKEVDAVTMFFGLEARVPFLAANLVSVASRIPQSLKVSGSTEKFVLRRAFEDVLPPAITGRQKLGFPVPVATWYRGKLGAIARDVVLSRRALSRGIFDEGHLRQLVLSEELSSDCSRNQTFRFLVLELWLRRFLENDDTNPFTPDTQGHCAGNSGTS
ncbi:MAG: asparagine synthase (glutamine-hydrolyzing) [Xanthobacteraceae bacterium]